MTDNQYFVLVAGSGETSRANVEALMADHYYASGNNGVLVLSFDERPSQGQVWAAQLAKSQNIDVVVFAKANAFLDTISNATFNEEANPISKAFEFVAGKQTDVFLLWNDEDPVCTEALAICKKNGILALDLCDGLSAITPSETLEVTKEEPVKMPPIEAKANPHGEEDQEFDEDEDEEDEEDDEEEEEIDSVYFGVEAIAKVFARALVEEMKEQGFKGFK